MAYQIYNLFGGDFWKRLCKALQRRKFGGIHAWYHRGVGSATDMRTKRGRVEQVVVLLAEYEVEWLIDCHVEFLKSETRLVKSVLVSPWGLPVDVFPAGGRRVDAFGAGAMKGVGSCSGDEDAGTLGGVYLRGGWGQLFGFTTGCSC